MKFISVGEVLWDVVGEAEHLGGAPLNFSAHAVRLGHTSYLVSAVGEDDRGDRARREIERLGVGTEYLHTIPDHHTGCVNVNLRDGQPCFTIYRPGAYDFIELDNQQVEQLSAIAPEWIYFGTLAQTSAKARSTTTRLTEAIPSAKRFYDVNLRKDCYDQEVVQHLLASATVAKLNDLEITIVASLLGDANAISIEDFCHEYQARFGWDAVCVTRGEKGCALLLGDSYVEAPACPVTLTDAIGAGDAFAAGLVHALSLGWEAARAAEFANRVGALVASRAGAIPAWSLQELDCLPQHSAL